MDNEKDEWPIYGLANYAGGGSLIRLCRSLLFVDNHHELDPIQCLNKAHDESTTSNPQVRGASCELEKIRSTPRPREKVSEKVEVDGVEVEVEVKVEVDAIAKRATANKDVKNNKQNIREKQARQDVRTDRLGPTGERRAISLMSLQVQTHDRFGERQPPPTASGSRCFCSNDFSCGGCCLNWSQLIESHENGANLSQVQSKGQQLRQLSSILQQSIW